MTKNKLISFLLGLLVSGLISGMVYFILFLETFDLFGIAEIKDPESVHSKYFYTGLVMTILSALVFLQLYRNNRKFTAIGSALPNLIGLYLVIRFGMVYLDKSNYYEKFDSQIWIASTEKPLKMARGLVKEKTLIGLSKDETLQMLGQGKINKSEKTETLIYETEYWYCSLGITLENDKVSTASLWVAD